MSVTPVLHMLAGPNGAGKTTFYREVLALTTHLEFINADMIASERWPDATAERSYEAAAIAAAVRAERLAARASFATETVFSHESKVALLQDARAVGYHVALHVVLVPEDLAVARVASRVACGGHPVPEEKIRGRYARLFEYLSQAVSIADTVRVYDNTRAAAPFILAASYQQGHLVGTPHWSSWIPAVLRAAAH